MGTVKSVRVAFCVVLVFMLFVISCDEYRDLRYGAILFQQGSEAVSGDSVLKNADGSIIIAGNSGNNLWVAKIDSNTDVVWEKIYDTGGPDAKKNNTRIIALDDGGYLIATVLSQSYGDGSYNVWLIQTDDSGNTVWEKTWHTENQSTVRSLTKTTDGNYLVAGTIYNSADSQVNGWILKTDNTGSCIWQKRYTQFNIISSVRPIGSGQYLVAGYTDYDDDTVGVFDAAAMIIDTNGTVLKAQSYGRISMTLKIKSAVAMPDGGYLLAGDAIGSRGTGAPDSNCIFIKVDENLALQWQTEYDFNTDVDAITSVVATSDGGAVALGFGWTGTIIHNRDVFCMKISADGTSQWQKLYELGISGEAEYGYDIHETQDGFTASGNVALQGFVMGMDENGDIPGADIDIRNGSITGHSLSLVSYEDMKDVYNTEAEETAVASTVTAINSGITKL